MPIEIPNETSVPVSFPNKNIVIARYFNLVKFLSLIQTKKVYFSRLDKFEDKYEGTYPELNNQEYKYWYTNFLINRIMPLREINLLEEVEQAMLDEINLRDRFKSVVCVSCWNKFEAESYALWKIYSSMDQGIMIKTKVENIISAFNSSEENIIMSEVSYIDFSNSRIKSGNMYYPIIHKNIHYDYEKEVRLIHCVNFDPGLKYDWKNEEIEFGKYIKVDLEMLIDEIIVSPYAPKWFFETIVDLLEKYNINKPIRYSDLK